MGKNKFFMISLAAITMAAGMVGCTENTDSEKTESAAVTVDTVGGNSINIVSESENFNK